MGTDWAAFFFFVIWISWASLNSRIGHVMCLRIEPTNIMGTALEKHNM